jgi:hypothetical protein
MKQLILIFICLSPYLPSNDWQIYTLGNEFLISFPANIDTSKITDSSNFSLELSKGEIMVSRNVMDIPINSIGELGIESYAKGNMVVLEKEKNLKISNNEGYKISGIPAYTYQYINEKGKIIKVVHVYYQGFIYSFRYKHFNNDVVNPEKDKFFQSIRIKNQWKGDWEVFDVKGNYQFLLSLSDTSAISNYYCLQNCFYYSSDYYDHQSKKCFVNNPFNGFKCIQQVNGDTLWLELFKKKETQSTELMYSLRVNSLKPKHFNYDETLVQIKLPEAGETLELLMARKRFSNILIGPTKNNPAKVSIQVNDVLIKNNYLNLFVKQELDKLTPETKKLVIHLHADKSISDQELITLFKNTNIDQHKLYRVYVDQNKHRVGIKLMKF